MKTVLSLLTTLVLSWALIGSVAAQQRSPGDMASPPRGVEGPEIRKQAPKGAGGTEAPATEKKGTRAGDRKPKDMQDPPKGVEGPEIRKQERKGTGGTEEPKTKKKSPRAKSDKPRYTDSPPKRTGERESKQDGGTKSQ